MPGLSIVIGSKALNENSLIRNTLKEQNYLNEYKDKLLLTKENLFLGANIYEQYPIRIIEKDKLFIVVEGKIYNKDSEFLENEIFELIKKIDKNDNVSDVSKFLQSSDGDYLIFAHSSYTNNSYLLNDIFGRLPIYLSKDKNGNVIISRYLNFINQLSEEVEFDKLAISQFLTFGFLLNNRTLYENINQLRPASLVRIHDNTVQIQNMFKFNFQNRANENKNIKEVINDLHDLFSTSCKNRFQNDNKNVVALSGGLDSRLVVSSMFYNKIPFSTITFVHKYGSVINDEQIAVQLANIFNVQHNTVQINPPSGLDVYIQLKIKEGMNSLFTSYLHSFYYKVNEVFGNKINLITGDNGDKLIFTLDKPIRKFGSDDELSEYILNQHSILEPEMILQLTNLRKNEMLNEIVSLLKTFPEENLWNKYVHFKVSERPFKFAFQGEDRHRSFFWNISPFWSFPFYNYLMNCTDKIKKNHKVFGGLIKSFSDEAIKLPYSNFKSSIVSLKGKVALSFLYHVYPKIPKNLKTKFKVGILGWNPNVKNDSILIQCIKGQRKSCNEISNYLNLDSNFNLESMGKATLFNVLTLTSVIEDYFKEESTIEQFPDREFI